MYIYMEQYGVNLNLLNFDTSNQQFPIMVCLVKNRTYRVGSVEHARVSVKRNNLMFERFF
jgi:hypothetical protein